MHIVFVHTDLRIYWPARLKSLALYLKARQIDLDIIEIAGKGSPYAFAEKSNDESCNWHILFPDKRMEELKNNNIKQELFHLLDTLYPDIIIAGAIAFPSGALSVLWAHINKKKVIIFDDAKIDAVPRNKFINYIKQNIYNAVYAMLYPSDDWIETGKFWGFGQDQLFYGVDVVDNSFWQDYTRSDLPSKHYFLSIGRQIPAKNFTLILSCYRRYVNKYRKQSLNLMLVGDGPEHYAIKKYVENHNLNEYVALLPFKNQNELKSIYHNASAFILASNNETWGLVINEAMACGLPVIASRQCGATHSLINDGINGFSFSPDSENDLYNKMCQYHCLSETDKTRMAEASLQIIKNWGLEKFCESCYEAICYSAALPIKKLNFVNSIIVRLWKGRYRPI